MWDLSGFFIWFYPCFTNTYDWLVVWNMAVMTFHSVGNVRKSQLTKSDELIFFSGVGQPATRINTSNSVVFDFSMIYRLGISVWHLGTAQVWGPWKDTPAIFWEERLEIPIRFL
jgi:hypothetical protein